MKRLSTLAALAFVTVIGFSSCGKKESAGVPEMERYKDPYLNFSLEYPKTWVPRQQYGKVDFFSSDDAIMNFQSPSGSSSGAKVDFRVTKLKALKPLDSLETGFRNNLEWKDAATFGAKENATLGTAAAVRVPYAIKITSSTSIKGFYELALLDSSLYALDCSAFNEQYDALKPTFDSIAATIRYPEAKVAGRDVNAPAETFDTYASNYLDIQYPSNFEANVIPKRGGDIFSVQFGGERLDCTYRVDVKPAKGLLLDKVYSQLKNEMAKNFRITGEAATTINGVPARYVNLTPPQKDIKSRAYILVQNDKFYRVFMNWYGPKAKEYLPAFEKAVASLKIKG